MLQLPPLLTADSSTAWRLLLNLKAIRAIACLRSAVTAAHCGSAAAYVSLCHRSILACILAAAVAEGTGSVCSEGLIRWGKATSLCRLTVGFWSWLYSVKEWLQLLAHNFKVIPVAAALALRNTKLPLSWQPASTRGPQENSL